MYVSFATKSMKFDTLITVAGISLEYEIDLVSIMVISERWLSRKDGCMNAKWKRENEKLKILIFMH